MMMQFKRTTLLAGLDSSLMTGPRLWKDAPCSLCTEQSAASIVAALGLSDPRQSHLLLDVKDQVRQKIREWNLLSHPLENVSVTHLIVCTDGSSESTITWPRTCLAAGWAAAFFGITTGSIVVFLGASWGHFPGPGDAHSLGGIQPSAPVAEAHALTVSLAALRHSAIFSIVMFA
jgi:hypothetical protein